MPKLKLRRKYTWTPDLAYAVGLITTDGSLSNDGRHITYTSCDRDLIKTFKKYLNKTNKITPNPKSKLGKKSAFRIQFGDVVFYDWLKSIGLTPNKSLSIGGIKVNDKYFRDFLRGHLDGDGCIIQYKDKYLTHLNPKYIYDRLYIYLQSGSKKHILWLRENIYRLKGIKGSLDIIKPRSQRSNSSICRIKFSKKEAKILANWIYYKEGLPCLGRKMEKVKLYLLNYI